MTAFRNDEHTLGQSRRARRLLGLANQPAPRDDEDLREKRELRQSHPDDGRWLDL
jgi:hypothetical protein